jgi:hypothetical protein
MSLGVYRRYYNTWHSRKETVRAQLLEAIKENIRRLIRVDTGLEQELEPMEALSEDEDALEEALNMGPGQSNNDLQSETRSSQTLLHSPSPSPEDLQLEDAIELSARQLLEFSGGCNPDQGSGALVTGKHDTGSGPNSINEDGDMGSGSTINEDGDMGGG